MKKKTFLTITIIISILLFIVSVIYLESLNEEYNKPERIPDEHYVTRSAWVLNSKTYDVHITEYSDDWTLFVIALQPIEIHLRDLDGQPYTVRVERMIKTKWVYKGKK